jgi:hypothetical protein
MSKRYVIQVLDTITDENATNVYEIEATDAQGNVKTAWFNLQHPAGGNWMTRSSKTALRDAARLVRDGETRDLRVAVSQPIYSLTPFAEGTTEHVKLLAQITQDVADEATKYGFMQDSDYDEDKDAENAENEEFEDVALAVFEVVNEDKN